MSKAYYVKEKELIRLTDVSRKGEVTMGMPKGGVEQLEVTAAEFNSIFNLGFY